MSLSVFSSIFVSSPNQIAPLTAMKVIKDTTLAANNATFDSGTFDSYKVLQVYANLSRSGASQAYLRFNSDAGAHYAWRVSALAAAYATDNAGGDTRIELEEPAAAGEIGLSMYINNTTYSGNWVCNVTTTPQVGGFNFNAAVTSLQFILAGGETWSAGSRIIVTGV